MALQIRSIISSLIDLPPLSLYDKTIRFSFPFLNKDGIQLKFNTVDFSWMKRQMFHQVSCNILNT